MGQNRQKRKEDDSDEDKESLRLSHGNIHWGNKFNLDLDNSGSIDQFKIPTCADL